MIIGVPKEVKTDEFRVGITPSNIAFLVDDGHEVFVETMAGEGSGFSDAEYRDVGAKIVFSAKELYEKAHLVVKVKEPQPSEYGFLNEKHTLFCYLHLAPTKELTVVLMQKRVCAIAYETVAQGRELPLLKPMSEIAGSMAPIVGAYHLSRYKGGDGVLICGSEEVEAAKVLVVGAGNAGFNAAKIASGMGADVTVINRTPSRLEELKKQLPHVRTLLYSENAFLEAIKSSDMVIGAVLIHGGAPTPKFISREILKEMKNGSILVDITIDQGGISEASHPTTHTNPTFIEERVLHYCVANMPGAYPKTSTVALSNATISYVRKLANDGVINAIRNNASLALGVNVFNGALTNRAVAEAHNLEYKALDIEDK
ncbi:MAG: alanine dehydrogenase [Sulfurimonas sp.]|uniref:alanine dehydrogenase n=1 Tax=Sulfurimonas sp. TaxID=2022749 RepID=UPI0028CD89BE|nr:alanine dehydrogenase [Sulfurimonas sp.]MDT8337618.1 alanine dehydrogenase [Sulfurimonas sp.]